MLHTRHFAEKAADRWPTDRSIPGTASLQKSWDQGRSVLQASPFSPWWSVGLGSLLLTLLNGPLVLSLGMGIAVYAELSRLTAEDWQQLTQRLQRPPHLPLSPRAKTRVATAAALLLTFLVTSLWAETHYFWLAAIMGGQSVLALWLAGLLLQPQLETTPVVVSDHAATMTPALDSIPTPETTPEMALDRHLGELSAADALARLVAVRQLMRLAQTHPLEARYVPGSEISLRSHLLDCFHLMLAQEGEPMVRSALKEGLDLLRQPAQLPAGEPPMQPLQQTIKKTVRRPVVEYVEP